MSYDVGFRGSTDSPRHSQAVSKQVVPDITARHYPLPNEGGAYPSNPGFPRNVQLNLNRTNILVAQY